MIRSNSQSCVNGARSVTAGERGFSLIELLVAIGVVAILMAILVPAVGSARRNAKKNAIQAQLASITTALDAYAQAFNGYSPPSHAWGTTNNCTYFDSNGQRLTGPQMLAEAMVGWMPLMDGNRYGDGAGRIINGGSNLAQGVIADTSDFGFRNRGRGATAVGTVYGPYLSTDPNSYDAAKHVLVDAVGNPIRYYRLIPQSSEGVTRQITRVFDARQDNYDTEYPSTSFSAWFDANDEPDVATRAASVNDAKGQQFRVLLGVPNVPNNNQYTGSMSIALKYQKYILVSGGVNGTYYTGDNVVDGR